MKFIFQENIKNDIWNWQTILESKGQYGQDWFKGWPKDLKKSDAKDKTKLRSYLRKQYYENNAVKKYAEWLNASFNPKRIDDNLLKITGHRIPFKTVTVNLTTAGRCPYDPQRGTFYVNYGAASGWVRRVALHECMHFIVHRYYWEKMEKAGLSDKQCHDVKEALTVLLDPVFKLWGMDPEPGYPNHQKFRKDIDKISAKTKNFDEIIDETIKIFLKKYKEKVS